MSFREPPKSVAGLSGNGLDLASLTLESRAIASRYQYKGTKSIPIVPPICHASTYRLEFCEDFFKLLKEGGGLYGRMGNETTESVEAAINVFEEGAGSMVFSSGMAAISTIFTCFLKAGDHVVAHTPSYSGSLAFMNNFCSQFKIDITYLTAGCSSEDIKKQVKPNTRIFYGETPCNPAMQILDLEAIGKLGQGHERLLTVIDGTFASCYLQQPIKYGIDISIHSCTKYLGGHSDLMAGCLTTRTVQQWKALKMWQAFLLGNHLNPYEANLLLRSLRTLPLRMEKHSANGLKVATFLENHPKVLRVAYPGLSSHPQHEVAKKQMKGFGGMIMAEVKGGSKGGQTVVENVQLMTLALSLGGVYSLIEHPFSMSHGPYLLTPKEVEEAGIAEGMLRISIGIEDADDIIKDLDRALAKIPE